MNALLPMVTALTCLLLGNPVPAAQQEQSWNFRVHLDGKPIGFHRFDLSTQNSSRTLISDAEFAVRVLGITVYRYRHQATEHWQADCLQSLHSRTDDGGKQLAVALRTTDLPGCAMSYAYWNPRLLEQNRLVNAQTGRIDTVQITHLGAGEIQVHGMKRRASRWRITGLPHPIDLWYAEPVTTAGTWLGLDSYLDNRVLSYRLE